MVAELGLLEEFLRLPHQQVTSLSAEVYGERIPLADFAHVPTRCKFIAMMPQWDFLDFLARHARALPNFTLLQRHEVTALRRAGGKVTGVTAQSPDGIVHIDADLVAGTDGRHSIVRREAQLPLIDFGAPIDVLWFRLAKDSNDRDQTAGYIWPGLFFVTIDRGVYWQCALVIPKGGGDTVRAAGFAGAARTAESSPAIPRGQPRIADRHGSTETAGGAGEPAFPMACAGSAVYRRPRHMPCRPWAVVGINLAVQDAVAAARLLAAPLREGRVTAADLQAVQDRRMLPTRLTQRAQVLVQERVISPVVQAAWDETQPMPRPPYIMRLIQRYPQLGRIPARLIGVGVRPEHI